MHDDEATRLVSFPILLLVQVVNKIQKLCQISVLGMLGGDPQELHDSLC